MKAAYITIILVNMLMIFLSAGGTVTAITEIVIGIMTIVITLAMVGISVENLRPVEREEAVEKPTQMNRKRGW